MPYRDRDAYAAIVAALAATGEFAEVVFAVPLDHAPIGAGRSPLAVVVPDDWTEVDDVGGTGLVRHAPYALTLAVRDEDPQARFQRLDRLTSVVQNAIDGTDLGGGCLTTLTRIGSGRYDPAPRHPEQRVTLAGRFAYLIASASGHS